MVVTDLHGDWDAYRQYRDQFLKGFQAGQLDYLIIAGDVIHRESLPQHDKSLEMVLDIIQLQQTYPQAIYYLCGNHEFPHIFSITLAKGNFIYTPGFEARLREHRPRVIEFFKRLPFYVRTSAGVSIAHAGAAASMSVIENCQRIFNFDYQEIFDKVEQILKDKDLNTLRNAMARFSGEPYHVQAHNYLAISSRDDPRYDDLLKGFIASSDPDFGLLWAALFTRCEKEYSLSDYRIFLKALLQALSDGFYPQNILVAGHINVNDGYQIIGEGHLRMASGKHAQPLRSARYLIFDVAKPIPSAKQLIKQLRSIY
jgi:hypothetical protein